MADKHSMLTQERLNKLYEYNPDTGLLMSRTHNKPVGYNHNDYLVVDIDSKHVKVHRIIWMLIHGRWPHPMIDHINGNRKDNRLCNLREVTSKQNAENNRGKGAKSKGVLKSNSRWKAQITHNKQTIYLGTFEFENEAHKAYCQAAKLFHTHNPNSLGA